MTKTLLIHEYVSGGGMARLDPPQGWLNEGRAMACALARDFAALPGVSVVRTFDARRTVDTGAWNAALIGPGEERDRLIALARQADASLVVAPETGNLLAERIAWIRDCGAVSLNCTESATALAGDKWRTYLHVMNQGKLRQPATHRAGSRAMPLPYVAKPIDGAGSIETRLVSDESIVSDDAGMLYQEFIPGSSYSASFLVDRTGRPAALGIARQNVSLVDGAFCYQGGTVPAGEPVWCEQVVRAFENIDGLRGWVGIDFVVTAIGELVFLEINPRPTTSFVGFQHILAPGTIARHWLQGIEHGFGSEAGALAWRVSSAAPRRFNTTGNIDVESLDHEIPL